MNQLAIRAFRGRRKLRGCLDRMQRTRPTNSRRSCRPSGPPQCGAAAARYRKVEGLAAFNASPELFLGPQKQMLIERVGRSRDPNPLPPLGERKGQVGAGSFRHGEGLQWSRKAADLKTAGDRITERSRSCPRRPGPPKSGGRAVPGSVPPQHAIHTSEAVFAILECTAQRRPLRHPQLSKA